MKFDHSKLAGRIKEKFGSQAKLAKHIGMGESSFSYRMSNRIQFDADEIARICAPDCLDIASHDIYPYFFTQEVLESRTENN